MNAEQDNRQAPPSYADEVLCANWHPLVLLLAEPLVPLIYLDMYQIYEL